MEQRGLEGVEIGGSAHRIQCRTRSTHQCARRGCGDLIAGARRIGRLRSIRGGRRTQRRVGCERAAMAMPSAWRDECREMVDQLQRPERQRRGAIAPGLGACDRQRVRRRAVPGARARTAGGHSRAAGAPARRDRARRRAPRHPARSRCSVGWGSKGSHLAVSDVNYLVRSATTIVAG